MLLTWASSRGRPSLNLNFLQGIADPRITYSGGANGTRVNSAGVIVAATTPRFDYNPVTLAARGLLVEEARTNLCLDSGDWSTGLFLATAAPVTPATGGLCNQRISFTASANALTVKYNPAGNSTLQYANTVRLKAGTKTSLTVAFRNALQTIGIQYTANLTAVTLTDTSYGSPTSKITPSIRLVGGGEYEITIGGVLNAGGGAEITGFYVLNTDGVAGTADVGAGQIEVGGFGTSYIGPTAGAAVTRTADSAVMTGTNFSSWYNQSEGTFVVAASSFATDSLQRRAFAADDGTTNNYIDVSRFGNTAQVRAAVVTSGSTVFNSLASTYPVDTAVKVANSYQANNFAACLGGGSVATDASGSIPTVDRLRIGNIAGGSNSWTGHIRTLQFYPQRLPNAQLQALTA